MRKWRRSSLSLDPRERRTQLDWSFMYNWPAEEKWWELNVRSDDKTEVKQCLYSNLHSKWLFQKQLIFWFLVLKKIFINNKSIKYVMFLGSLVVTVNSKFPLSIKGTFRFLSWLFYHSGSLSLLSLFFLPAATFSTKQSSIHPNKDKLVKKVGRLMAKETRETTELCARQTLWVPCFPCGGTEWMLSPYLMPDEKNSTELW